MRLDLNTIKSELAQNGSKILSRPAFEDDMRFMQEFFQDERPCIDFASCYLEKIFEFPISITINDNFVTLARQ